MPRLRFETVRDLLEAFPIAERLIEVEPSDEPSLRFLEGLVARDDLDRAVGFCAFLLPRREAVWWGCRTVRALVSAPSREEDAVISSAEAWVRQPEDERRARRPGARPARQQRAAVDLSRAGGGLVGRPHQPGRRRAGPGPAASDRARRPRRRAGRGLSRRHGAEAARFCGAAWRTASGSSPKKCRRPEQPRSKRALHADDRE